MRWQWKLGRFAGIDVYIHATFLLILGFVAWSHWSKGPGSVLEGLLFVLALFLCVVLHEYGHALAARAFGISTRDITLYPIGGVARLERMPDKPIQELWVALAGPAVNMVLAVLLLAWLLLERTLQPFGTLSWASGPFLERLLVANATLAIFNLFPAFPMDGGRVLRALLAMRMHHARATRIAAGIGQGGAMVLGLLGLFGNPMLIFIALFVWIGAGQEAEAVQMKTTLDGVDVQEAMVTDFRTLTPDAPLSDAMKMLLTTSQQDFPVVSGVNVVGMLTRSDLLEALGRRSQETLVADVMLREFPRADPREGLEALFQRLQTCGCNTIPVVQTGALVGLVTAENLGEFLMVRTALAHGNGGHPSLPASART